jgi:hypothetical protein
MSRFPKIADRYVPPVAGIDLAQSLNYTDATGLPLNWFYESFTYPRVFYQKGSRPGLEQFLARRRVKGKPSLALLQKLLTAVAQAMPHYICLTFEGIGNRGWTEEELLESGHGWCNEQARVFVALAQVLGMPARLVFAAMKIKKGHVVAEVYVGGKWVLTDPIAAFIFRRKNGRPVNLLDIKSSKAVAREADARYQACIDRSRRDAVDKSIWDKHVAWGVKGRKAIALFHAVGYCNYFIH